MNFPAKGIVSVGAEPTLLGFMMIARRDKILFEIIGVSLLGIIVLAVLGRFLWYKSVQIEEERLSAFSDQLGQQVESAMIDVRDMLVWLNQSSFDRCSPKHLQLMQESAVARPYIRAIGYWRAADRLCGAGFIQGVELTPPHASRIYDSGVIAWWPSAETQVGNVQLFIMRFGEHDVVIDPRLLMNFNSFEEQKAALWVEGLLMISTETQTDLPQPQALAHGLTVDNANQRILSRFSLGSIFPIDVVAQQPINEFWQRYLPTLLAAGLVILILLALWVFIVLRYSRQRLSLVAELRDAIMQGDIRVKYQPIINMDTGFCTGAESLARWLREGGEEVSPDVFIPIAERAGLVTELTTVMLKNILLEMGEHLITHPDMVINLNISAQDLADDSLVDCLEDELRARGVAASSIGLEITERALIDSDVARQRIHTLRQRGHRIAIDDFGTGYSSLSYLESFDLDVLKVDRAFTAAVETQGVTNSVITHIIEMAKSLNLKVVAEGVESEHQAEWLIQQNVLLGQGYLFSKPLTARKFIDFFGIAGRSNMKKGVKSHPLTVVSNKSA